MPRENDLRLRLTTLSADLRPSDARQEKELARLEKRLTRSLLHNEKTAHVARELSVERADLYAPEKLPAERLKRLDDLAAAADSDQVPEFRVFRREVPLAAHGLETAAPAWGRGAAIEATLGPFDAVDGRRYWFDFFPIVRLVPLYFAGDSQPALLFYLSRLKLRPGAQLPISDALKLLQRRQARLAGSSVWVRADLLAAGAPAGAYVGLRIEGGSLRFNSGPVEVDGKITLPPGGRCRVELELKGETEEDYGESGAGIDARRARLALPRSVSFRVRASGADRLRATAAGWRLYGREINFDHQEDPAPSYEPLLRSVLIPYAADAAQLEVADRRSPVAGAAGEAALERAAWALPVAFIDVESPTQAAGAGSLAVQTAAGLSLDWPGLRDGPVELPNPWIVLAPGLIYIVDLAASGRYTNQLLRLWRDEDSAYRSELHLRYGESFALAYAAGAAGTELVLAQTDAEARLDRPIDVTGTPLPVKTLDSLVLFSFSDDLRLVLFYEDDILVDSLAPEATWPVEPGDCVALAIRNALFTVTPVNSLLLFAELRDEEMVERGVLLLGLGLYGLLPTLPDPYAANVSWMRRQIRTGHRGRRATLLLVAAVAWRKAAGDEDPDGVTTRFAFAPLGAQANTVAAWSSAGADDAAAVAATPAVDADSFTGAAAGRAAAFATRVPKPNQGDWDQRYRRFYQEQFALLDVSSNADQMGVSFAWFNPRSVDDGDYVFYQVYRPKNARQATTGPYPVQVQGLDLSAESRFVRAFTVPQISWEPLFNLPNPQQPPIVGDPPVGFNFYPDDGGPTRLLNDSVELVPIAPIPVTEFLVEDFDQRADGFTGALFTLPFGLRAFAELSRDNQFQAALEGAKLEFNRPEYRGDTLRGGLQLRADAPEHPQESPIFKGGTLQLNNVLNVFGQPTFAGTLGSSVGIVFNQEFFYDGNTGYNDRGVPLTRIDFSGYGASIFSHWQNPNAVIAATSQARFDVFIGRTGHEVIQVRSLVYPWGIRVVRTITIFRVSSSYVFRFDSGWQAESDGLYDFSYRVYDPAYNVVPVASPYTFHPGVVRGVFRVRNIREIDTIPKFEPAWFKQDGDFYVDANGIQRVVDNTTPANERNPTVILQPLTFDVDVEIDDVISGAAGGRVPSRGMLGYVQLAPRGEPLSPELFSQLLSQQFGALGGPVECAVDIGQSGQQMRISRVDVNASRTAANQPIFVSAARGSVVLPKDGSWSVVQHNQGTGEVSPLPQSTTVPLIRRGELLDPSAKTTNAGAGDRLRLANPIDLVKPLDAASRNYGLLQSTGTQKALFRLPEFRLGVEELKTGVAPEFADGYRMLNSAGIFPNVQDALPLVLGNFKTNILEQGYQLLDQAQPDKVLEQVLPEGPLYLINEDFLKLYVEYAKKDKDGTKTSDGVLSFGIDSAAQDLGKKWLSKLDDIGMVVDLGPLKRLMIIKGKFDAEKGALPTFKGPELEFSDALQPVIDILQILLMLQGGDYKDAFAKGLEIAMSNSADSWTYAFHARKEIPVVRFPPPALDSPTAPLRLECGLAVGVYFNEVFDGTGGPGQLVPSAGAFLEFNGRLSVMCVSVAAATIYAVGSVDLRLAADIKTGPSLLMKFGFGAEINVGLPVVGTVSLLYMVGVEILLETQQMVTGAFLLFRGRAEILGGIITVTITIEAKGLVKRLPAGRTDMIAQVSFGLDISIFLVINISFSESWQESRQIA